MVRRLTKMERETLREAGTPADIHNRIKAYTSVVTRLNEQQRELVAKYPRQWVAFKDGEVVCHGATLARLTADCANKGVSIRDVAIRFLDTEKRIIVL